MASASTITAPRRASNSETVDLPEPMPPVRPITSTRRPYHRAHRRRPLFPAPGRATGGRPVAGPEGPAGAGATGRGVASLLAGLDQRLAPPRHHQAAGVEGRSRALGGAPPRPGRGPRRLLLPGPARVLGRGPQVGGRALPSPPARLGRHRGPRAHDALAPR